jgi:hypothetical protein
VKPNDQITIKLQTPGIPPQKQSSSSTNNFGAGDTELKWDDVLTNARRRPGVFIGSPSDAHLEALRGAITFLIVTRPFEQPFAVHIVCSPTQYVFRCSAGPLLKVIERSVEWNTDRMLVDLLRDPHFNRTQGTPFGFGMHPVHLAERFFVGIASRSGFRHQTYREGWPTTDVLVLEEKSPYSFVIAGQLTPEWFTGLPFRWKDVKAVVTEFPSVHITWEMRSSDDILPQNSDSMAELCL